MSPGLSIQEVARRLWRRKWWIVIPPIVGVAAAVGAIFLSTPLYRASTMILVEPQKIPTDYIKATVTTSLDERLKTIEQQITNRENLERIVEEMNLYPELRSELPIDVLIKIARNDLTLQVQGNSVFRIFFRGPDPEKVAHVANWVAEAFIDENLKLRESQARNTSAFLEEELVATKGQLEEQESKVAAFRLRHEGQLPEQRESNLSALSQLRTKLELIRGEVNDLELRQSLLVRTSGPRGLPSPVAGPSRLEELRAELAQLRSTYTDNHPDVIRLEREVAALQASGGGAVGNPGSPIDPALDAQLAATELELRHKRAEQQKTLAEIASYQYRLEQIPRVEQELLRITRDYDNVRSSYESLLGKRIEARLAENLETERQSEQFTILERAVPPSRPYSPNKLLFLALGLAGGLAIGVGLAFFRDQVDQTFEDADSLESAFPAVPVLAIVPRLKVRDAERGAEVA